MILRRQRGQTLILIAAWLFFSGGASSALMVYDHPTSEMKKEIKRAIPDGRRRDAILLDFGQWESGQEQRDERVSADREELFKTMRRQDAQRSAAVPIILKLDQSFLEMDRNLLDFRFRVKEQVTRKEWAEIVARPNR